MSHWARPGVKCVCINNLFFGRGSLQDVGSLLVGRVYTVKEVLVDEDGFLGITLIGVENESLGFLVSRFLPLITRCLEQDMELFTPLLDVRNHDELERELQ